VAALTATAAAHSIPSNISGPATCERPGPDAGECSPSAPQGYCGCNPQEGDYMKLSAAVDLYCIDMWGQGRFTSPRSETDYRIVLDRHADDVNNKDPRWTNRENVKTTLSHWRNPNSQRKNRAILVSFYDWLVEEGHRASNPARQTRRPKKRQGKVYKPTQSECIALLKAAQGPRERRVIYLGLCAGLRRQELLGMQGRHFAREGLVWVSADIGKGGKERHIPVIADLEPIVQDIRENVGPDDYILPAQRWRDPGINREKEDKHKHPSSPQAIYRLVKRVGEAAGISGDIHPHSLRHGFTDHISRYAGVRNAQFLLGHATIGTTEGYLSKPTLDEIRVSIAGLSYEAMGGDTRTDVPGQQKRPSRLHEATTGIEPVSRSFRLVEGNKRASSSTGARNRTR
jgi:integrase